jgi:cytochrome c553
MQSMIDVAKAMTDEEMTVTADYYGSIKFIPTIRVVETDRVPKTRISTGLFLPVAGGGTEPIGDRIIEVPEDPQTVDVLRSPRIGFIAYVPKGSVSKGEALVTTGGGKSPLPCSECHGADLRGLPVVPAIAGRSPSYIVRQMFDMKSGTRKGPGVDAMKPVLANLTPQDMLAIAAYVSSRQP